MGSRGDPGEFPLLLSIRPGTCNAPCFGDAGECGDSRLNLRVSRKLRQAEALMQSRVPQVTCSVEIPTRLPSVPIPAAAPLGGRERGLGPTEETAKALLFHDPLLIRTGLAAKSRAHSHKNMVLQRGKFCWLRGCIWWKFLYGSFFLFFFISLCCIFFSFFVIVDFCFIFYKTLALKDSNTIQTAPPIPTPGAPS